MLELFEERWTGSSSLTAMAEMLWLRMLFVWCEDLEYE